jgi:hypothetical protein
MQNIIFDKTDKGREEIITRKFHLASRLRTLLVLVDGKHTSDDLLGKVAAIGLTQASLEELEQQGYIQRQNSSIVQTDDDYANSQINSIELIQVLYNFYTESIKQNLGLRGYNLQFIVERATTLQDFHDLRTAFLDAVNKVQSEKKAFEIRDQLDELLSIMPIRSTKK